MGFISLQIPLCEKCSSTVLPESALRGLASYLAAVKKGEAEIQKADVLIVVGTRRNFSSFDNKGVIFVINNKYNSCHSDKNVVNITHNANEVFKILQKKLNI